MSRSVQGFDAAGNEVLRQATPAEEANLVNLIGKANTALTNNATFLAIASPTAAQVATQSKALTRQTNAVIRMLLAALTDVSDT